MRDNDKQYLAEIVASSGDAIVGQTLDGAITCWNAAAERLLGWPAAAMLGEPASRLLPTDRRDAEREMIARVVNGAPVAHLHTGRRARDGSTIAVFATVSPIRRADGSLAGISTILRDLHDEVAELQPEHAGPRATVLLVEDDADLLDLLREALHRDGHEVIAASDGRTALGLLGLHPEVAAVVSDIVMPNGVSGVLLAREAQRLRPDLPVLLMSGHPPEEIGRLGNTSGYPFLVKPFRPDELTSELRRLLH